MGLDKDREEQGQLQRELPLLIGHLGSEGNATDGIVFFFLIVFLTSSFDLGTNALTNLETVTVESENRC